MHPTAARLIVSVSLEFLLVAGLGVRADAQGLPPTIDSTEPPAGMVSMGEQTNLLFSVMAADPEGSNLVYQWRLGAQVVGGDEPTYLAVTTWTNAGIYPLRVDVSDTEWTTSAVWTVRVTPDNDGDGIPNSYENAHAPLDPWDRSDALADPDLDGLTNLREFQRRTSVTNADTDGDGLSDSWEARYGYDPNSTTGAIQDVNLTDQGQWTFAWNGQAAAAEGVGSHIFVGTDVGSLLVFDASDPSNVVRVGACETEGVVAALDVEGTHAYLAADYSGLQIVDISDPAHPVWQGTFNDGGRVVGVHVQGTIAYLADGYDGVRIVDVFDPAHPMLVGQLVVPGHEARGLQARGGYVYVAAGGDGVAILDVNNLANPKLVGRCSTSYAHNLVLAGDYAYVADNYGLMVINVAVPTNPVAEAAIAYSGAEFVAVDGDRLCLALYNSLQVFDIGSPTGPVALGTAYSAGDVGPFSMSGGRIDAPERLGLAVWDFRDRSNPVISDRVGTVGEASAIDVSGTFAYIAGGRAGLVVVDVSNPEATVERSRLGLPGSVQKVQVAGSHAYLGETWPSGGFSVVDVSDAEHPLLQGRLSIPSGVSALAVKDHHVYVSESAMSTLYAIDVADPTNPVVVGWLDTLSDVSELVIDGNYGFGAYGSGGLLVVDLSTPESPVAVAVAPAGEAVDVAVHQGYAYLASGDGGLYVVDVQDPTNPVQVAHVTLPGGTTRVTASGGYVHALTSAGVVVLDVRTPGDPTVVETVPLYLIDVFATGSTLYASRGESGLSILQLAARDSDGDGLPDFWEQDWFQGLDRDGRADFDGDGIPDLGEYTTDLNPLDPDQDGDGVEDGSEVNLFGSDPREQDSDGDGLDDGEEVAPGADAFVTSPTLSDTDDDSADDRLELALGRNPTVAEPVYATVFFDDMENDGTNWHAGGSWEIAHDDYDSAFSSWTDSPWLPYKRGATSFLSLQVPIDLSGYQQAWLKLRHTLAMDSDAMAVVGISTDGGGTWYELERYGGYQRRGWSDLVLPISDYCGYSNVRLGFIFYAMGSGLASSTGWHLDDIEVLAAASELGGTVDGDGAALPGASVLLRPRYATDDSFSAWAFTEADGSYAFGAPMPGEYVVRADAPAYAAQYHADTARVDDATPVALAFGGHRTVDFNLRPGQSPGQIQVTSEPAGASVYLDFEPSGLQTPALLSDIEPGSHFVSVMKSGYPVPAPRGVGVREAAVADVDFDLDVPAGALRVESAPQSGAAVYLDFQSTGLMTPCVITNIAVDLPAASHFISVTKAGLAAPGPVQSPVLAHETNLVSFVLPADGLGDLQVSSTPTGAVVWLDFRDAGRSTDVLLEDLAAGSHTVRVALPGFSVPAARGVTVETGRVARVHFNLGLADTTDADHDGLPDAWEHAEGLSTDAGSGGSGRNGADGDWDGDTMSNADERLAGTSPTDPGSVLEVFQATRGTNAVAPFSVTWQAVPGKRYRVDAKDKLTDPVWLPLTAFEAADGDTETFSDMAYPGLTNRVYRIVVLPYP
ncbi:MAG: PEGA domain-containing protein [Lentisphaerae bacterium]|nr:PEGA domain-containing protein [Lentisphaerota bacterium]